MKIWVSILMSAATGFLTAAEDGEKLLDRMISFPGSYSQVCDVMTAPQDIPYRAFEITDFAGASFSKKNQEVMAQNRDALVKAIRTRLAGIDFARQPKEPAKDPHPAESMDGDDCGCDPATLNPLLLELVRQLHAIEALPELLAVEAKLVKGIARAKDDVSSPPPVVAGWSVGAIGPYDENESDARRDRRLDLFQARVAQRDLVMLMALLMREKLHPPYLATSLEKAYVRGLKAQVKKLGLAGFQPGSPLPENLQHWEIEIDPVSKLPWVKHRPVEIPYSRESRDEIRAAAEQWISAR